LREAFGGRDIARVLGANTKGDGYLHGNGYVVTWAIGHLRRWRSPRNSTGVEGVAAQSAAHDPRFVAAGGLRKTKDQFETVRRILASRASRASSAQRTPREGELIFRYIYEAAHCVKPSAACGFRR